MIRSLGYAPFQSHKKQMDTQILKALRVECRNLKLRFDLLPERGNWKYLTFNFLEWDSNQQPSRLQSNACTPAPRLTSHIQILLYYVFTQSEVSRGAGAQIYDCKSDCCVFDSHSRNEIFNILISSLWVRGKKRSVKFRHSTHNASNPRRTMGNGEC